MFVHCSMEKMSSLALSIVVAPQYKEVFDDRAINSEDFLMKISTLAQANYGP